jgi:hypothetical protein
MKDEPLSDFALRASSPLAALGCARVLLVWLWPSSVLTLAYDDAYYYFAIARNAASDMGFTYDRIHATDGFHPLWMWVLVAIARIAGGDLESFVRVVLTVQLGLVFGATLWVLRGLPERVGRWELVFAIALLSGSHFVRILVNGLEPALEYALLMAALVLLGRFEPGSMRRPTVRDVALFALLLAALTLARLTMAFLAVPALLWVAWRSQRMCQALIVGPGVYAALVGGVRAPASNCLRSLVDRQRSHQGERTGRTF